MTHSRTARFLRQAFRAALLLALTAPFAPAATPAILAYETTDAPSSQALRARHGFFQQLAVDVYTVNARGEIRGAPRPGDLAFAQAQKLTVFATVANVAGGDFNGPIAHALITSAAARETFLAAALKLLAANSYTGLNLDIESVPASDRAAFTAFVRTVVERLRAAGCVTVVSVPAEEKDDPANSWSGAFDLKALGASADLLQLMTYDENGPWNPPGPVAGLDWVEGAVRYATSIVPAEKISLGVPAFAYDWDLDDPKKTHQLDWPDIAPLLAHVHGEPHWDDGASSPNFTYTLGGHRHIVWHEDARSLGLKARLVAQYHLAGLSVWCLGQEDDAFWRALAP